MKKKTNSFLRYGLRPMWGAGKRWVTSLMKKVSLGALSLAERLELTAKDLRALASQQHIPGRSTMDHDELAATVDIQT